MKKITLIALLVATTSLTGCAEFSKAMNEAAAKQQARQEFRRANNLAPEISDEMVDYVMAAQAQRNNPNSPEFLKATAERCADAAAAGFEAADKVLVRYRATMPARALSPLTDTYYKSCNMGFIAGLSGDSHEFNQAVKMLESHATTAKTKKKGMELAAEVGAVMAYKEGFKKSAGTYPVRY